MCKKMFDKFDKYWSEYSLVLAFGAIFDPRIKLVTLEHLYGEVQSDPAKLKEMISLLKTKLNKLFSGYADIIAPPLSQPRVSQVTSMQSESLGKSQRKRAFEFISYQNTSQRREHSLSMTLQFLSVLILLSAKLGFPTFRFAGLVVVGVVVSASAGG
ncbi:PREDICTED: zinc finger BED domain-containing protein DAYSLEEPER-like [Ipomoea nil]|uniref:zinc finger BED domain-containing protein DAYSLEEPER-like n=1 Tax=Ipomoea nil TaxID=35883 RepID=UPI000901B548|nr:PREDICTED: zinc finger BED domain-containing protein DAYSLEEPER-like [Ipomoea nil]